MDTDVFFIMVNGVQIGPMNLEQLQGMNIDSDTLIRRSESELWSKVSSFPELSVLHESIPPPYIPEKQSQPAKDGKLKQKNDNRKMFKGMLLFRGRARRLEYCIILIILLSVFYGFVFIFESLDPSEEVEEVATYVFLLLSYWVLLSEGSRRCHDLGLSGIYQFLPLIIFWLMFQDGEHWTNRWGNNPKGYNEFKPLGKI